MPAEPNGVCFEKRNTNRLLGKWPRAGQQLWALGWCRMEPGLGRGLGRWQSRGAAPPPESSQARAQRSVAVLDAEQHRHRHPLPRTRHPAPRQGQPVALLREPQPWQHPGARCGLSWPRMAPVQPQPPALAWVLLPLCPSRPPPQSHGMARVPGVPAGLFLGVVPRAEGPRGAQLSGRLSEKAKTPLRCAHTSQEAAAAPLRSLAPLTSSSREQPQRPKTAQPRAEGRERAARGLRGQESLCTREPHHAGGPPAAWVLGDAPVLEQLPAGRAQLTPASPDGSRRTVTAACGRYEGLSPPRAAAGWGGGG